MPLIQESLETSLQQNFSNIVGSEQTSSNFDDFDRKSSFFLRTTFWAKVWEEGCCRLSSSQYLQNFYCVFDEENNPQNQEGRTRLS